ncbi:MAG: hypothetical protein FLDDKLPJ_02148 [Phycisphaerae bacterium]|nr:hypothetical protein [Phycisphaerae bacterium]
MDVEIAVKVNAKRIKQHVEGVDGTPEPMKGTSHALSRPAGADALQAGVDHVAAPRPLFRKPAVAPSVRA